MVSRVGKCGCDVMGSLATSACLLLRMLRLVADLNVVIHSVMSHGWMDG